MTHAFFKALMFLGAGSVIHAMGGEQDMRKMGGLKKALPLTHLTFLCGWMAIIGVPFFSGFFSKDEILWLSFHSPKGSFTLWFIGAVTAVLTSFYMTRLMAMTFWGESRVSSEIKPHESPASMTFPLCVLAFLSLFAGWLCVPHGLGSILPGHPHNFLEAWMAPLLAPFEMEQGSLGLEFGLMALVFFGMLMGAGLAFAFYIFKPQWASKSVGKIKPLHRLVSNKYWVDEFYFGFLIRPLIVFSRFLCFRVDKQVIDAVPNGLSKGVRDAGDGLKAFQNGNLQAYGLYTLIGLVASLFFLMSR